MGDKTKISWSEMTWNPVTGCDKVSPGCKNCYAESLAGGLYAEGFKVTLRPERLEDPIRKKRSRLIFVNSMSDLFHKDIPTDYIEQVFDVMNRASWHTFQILTKRPERMMSLAGNFKWSQNIWAGVSVENQDYLGRLDILRQVPASIRFVSFEPLIGEIKDPNLTDIHWAIVGGESGQGARPMGLNWARQIREACAAYRTSFFFKQLGTLQASKGKGVNPDEWPEDLRIQEYPVDIGVQLQLQSL